MEPSDAELVARCQESQEAFVLLYRRHAPALYAFLRSVHRGDEHAAADALQETFLRAWHALPRFEPGRPMRPWLLRIALNVGLDALERGARQEARDPALLGAPSRELDPAQGASQTDACHSLLRRASRHLSARKLAAFVLSRGQGLTYEEIAAVQGCSTMTVKRDLAEARRALAGAAMELGLA